MKLTYIELAGRQYPLCCSLTAAAELDDAFGGLEQMSAALVQTGIRAKMEAINTVLEILMRAGRICVQAEGGEVPEPLACAPSDLLDVSDGASVKAIFSTIAGDTQREVESAPKKDAATPAGP